MIRKNKGYERPRVKTLGADQILELMGPVSCGSGLSPNPVDEDFGAAVKPSRGFSGLSN